LEQPDDFHTLIRMEGDATINGSAGLKQKLLEGLAPGRELLLDLNGVQEVDITLLQLLWAMGRSLAAAGCPAVLQMSPAVAGAARLAGFASFPGWTIQE